MTVQTIDLSLGVIQRHTNGLAANQVGNYYGPALGLAHLRSTVADLEGVGTENVALTTGATTALAAVLATLERPGQVLLPRPYYPSYPAQVAAFGLEPCFYEVNTDYHHATIDLATIVKNCGRSTRAVLVNTPGNPLGNVVLQSEMDEILSLASAHDALVIVDEVYGDFIYERSAADWQAVGVHPNLVRIKSFSKTLGMAGERLGYVVADQGWVNKISRAHWILAMSAPISAQLRVARLVSDGYCERIQSLVGAMAASRNRMVDIFASSNARIEFPRAGIFLWIQFPHIQLSAADIAQMCAQQARVRVMPGTICGVESPSSIRCAFGLHQELAAEAAHRLVSVFSLLETEPDTQPQC